MSHLNDHLAAWRPLLWSDGGNSRGSYFCVHCWSGLRAESPPKQHRRGGFIVNELVLREVPLESAAAGARSGKLNRVAVTLLSLIHLGRPKRPVTTFTTGSFSSPNEKKNYQKSTFESGHRGRTKKLDTFQRGPKDRQRRSKLVSSQTKITTVKNINAKQHQLTHIYTRSEKFRTFVTLFLLLLLDVWFIMVSFIFPFC